MSRMVSRPTSELGLLDEGPDGINRGSWLFGTEFSRLERPLVSMDARGEGASGRVEDGEPGTFVDISTGKHK
jgi:hypothetical protein